MNKPIKVLILDGVEDQAGDIFPPTAFVEYAESVILTKDFSNEFVDMLGKAKLYRHNNSFYIDDINWYDGTNKELLTKQAYLYPCVGGVIKERDGKNITHFVIDKIGLTLSPNCDDRIDSIKTQLEVYERLQ